MPFKDPQKRREWSRRYCYAWKKTRMAEDPEYAKRVAEQRSDYHKKRMADPDYVAKQRETAQRSYIKHKEKRAEYAREYNLANRDALRERLRSWRSLDPRAQFEKRLKLVYDITFADFDRLVLLQSGRCAICEKPLDPKGRGFSGLNIDHKHSTGVVRGLLCNPCNQALGAFRDDPERLRSAVQYLNRAPPMETDPI